MQLQCMPATAYRGCAGKRRCSCIVPQIELAGCIDEQVSDRDVACRAIAEQVHLARRAEQIEVDARVCIGIGARQRLLGVSGAVGGLTFHCPSAGMNYRRFGRQAAFAGPCRQGAGLKSVAEDGRRRNRGWGIGRCRRCQQLGRCGCRSGCRGRRRRCQ